MKSASIYYRSRTGITKKLAENIAEVLKNMGLAVSNDAVPEEVEPQSTAKAAESDLLFLGCWTGGWFLFLQHPDKPLTKSPQAGCSSACGKASRTPSLESRTS
jgi:hypothetical protein